MPTFPTLSKLPSYPLTEGKEDITMKSSMETGKLKTRYRYTKLRRNWSFKLENITATDKASLDSFVTTVHGATDIFTWTHPVSGEYSVRFSNIPVLELIGYDGSSYLYNTDIALLED